MRCWKAALDQIHDQHKVLPNYVARSKTEEALIDSLQQLELQCKERIDLLEALRISRQDASSTTRSSNVSGIPSPVLSESRNTSSPERGWIGQGTIPAIRYPELSRPALSKRPSLSSRTSSEQAVVGSAQSPGMTPPFAGSSQAMTGQDVRSPSPERYTMRTTLRSGKPGERTPRAPRKLAKNEGPGASKAATLAWGTLGSRERLNRISPIAPESSTSGSIGSTQLEQSRKQSSPAGTQWDVHTRRLITPREGTPFADAVGSPRNSDEFVQVRPSALSVSAASSALNAVSIQDTTMGEKGTPKRNNSWRTKEHGSSVIRPRAAPPERTMMIHGNDATGRGKSSPNVARIQRKPIGHISSQTGGNAASGSEQDRSNRSRPGANRSRRNSYSSFSDTPEPKTSDKRGRSKQKGDAVLASADASSSEEYPGDDNEQSARSTWKDKKKQILKSLPAGTDESAARQILNEIVVHGDQVRWSDVAGLEIAKNALREAVVYPFLRPDLFMGLREPARGMLLFGPPGTGKTMLARAVATESRSTFFSISASSLTSKYLGESEKLVRALFSLAKTLAPSIIFVDEIDSLLSQRSGSGEHEATRRIKTEFLIQWSDLQRAAAGRATDDKDKGRGDPNQVLVLAATNLPWAIDEAARRRFVRRQYIPLPESKTRSTQLQTLLGQQKHSLTDSDIEKLVEHTDGWCHFCIPKGFAPRHAIT